jgi:hypothetical protein
MSICYALLPVIPVWNIASGTLPLIIAVFCYFASRGDMRFSWKSLLLLLYPFFSFFATFGIFTLGFWFLGLIILSVKNKKINPNLLAGFFLLCIGYILTDLQLFYVMFVLKTPLNRAVFADGLQPINTVIQIKTLIHALLSYGAKGYYHAASFQTIIIIPLAFLVSLVCLIKLLYRRQQSIKTVLSKADSGIKLLFLLELTIVAIYIIAAVYDSGLLNAFIKKYVPILDGFAWNRVYVFNRILWYVVFGLCLRFILNCNMKLPSFLPKVIAGGLVCLQLGYIVLFPALYNDPVRTWFNEIAIKTGSGIARNILPHRSFNSFVSYKEFFAKDLFDQIKADISYSGERVVAFGYHPSVLMYNGFNCIDGYNNAYPLSYMREFRTLIAPELNIDQRAREYYDAWGGRMYLYNLSELDFNPTRNKNTVPVQLRIDMEVFRNTFNGTYILSRAEIANSDALGIVLVKRYYDEESIYTIYLYAVK